MPLRRNRDIIDVYDRIMARMEERLDQFVDQFVDRMNDMMIPRRCRDRNDPRSDGVVDDDYEEAPIFDDDQYEYVIEEEERFVGKGFVDNYQNFQEHESNMSFSSVVLGVEEESMPVYDTDIEDVIEEEEGFIGFGGEEDNIEDVVVVANDLFTKDVNHKNFFDDENPKIPNDDGRVSSCDDGTELSSDSQNDDDYGATSIDNNTHPEGNALDETDLVDNSIRRIHFHWIRRIQLSVQYSVKMDNPNITMEEYIRLEEEKAHRRGKVYNWETTTYGKIWYDEDVHDIRYIETEFLAIVYNDVFTSEVTFSCEPTVSPLNDKINFRISFDESDDEDYTPMVSYFNDFDFLKDFEKEFPAITYNDALTSKLDFLTEPTVSPQCIDEFNLKDETSLSKYDGEEQNVLYSNDLFPFNVIYTDDLKSNKDNDDDKINIEQSSGDNVINTDDGAYANGSNKLSIRRIQTPWIRCIDLLDVIHSIFFSIVDTAYSLNEYSVFDTGINTAYPGEPSERKDLVDCIFSRILFTKDVNHKNFFDNENPKRPNDDGRVSSCDDGTELSSDSQNDDDYGATSIYNNTHPEGNALDETDLVVWSIGCKPFSTPMEPNSVLSYIPTKTDPLMDNVIGYQKLLGKLTYLTHTIPDIAYSVHCLAQYMHSPLESHLNCALNVPRLG
ncbi:putative reverse transcriptase domain-containing protein [Tanacetum coccineum]|uniref:Reverse transcriptase domain-containing protein n=1 Tax=Tanacetum coccineum TaxID=301880 RepID=A0ABQ5ERN6_9ASTR